MTTADAPRAADAAGPAHGPADVEPPVPDAFPDWPRVVVWWDVAFVGIVLLTAVALAVGGQRGSELWIAYAAMAAILAAYAAWGAPAARSRDQRRATVYVVVLIAGTAVAVAQGGTSTFLLFGAFTQLWMLLEPPRRAVAASAVLAAATTVGIAWQDGFDTPTLVEAAPQMAVALGFALTLGLWTASTMRRADEHARLLCELRAAQAELARTNHAAGVAAERERLAREIHDTLAQGFTSVVMQAQAARSALERGDGGTARERLGTIEETARENLAEARGLVAASSPVALEGTTLAEALRRLGSRFAEETGVAVRVEVHDVGPLASGSQVVLLRAAQEGLANVRRHSGASGVVLRLAGGDGGPVTLEVADDGRGIAPEAAEGYGLSGMRERVAAGGGTVEVGPRDGGGTALRVLLPAGPRADA